MRIVRFKTQGRSKIECGCIERGRVYRLLGDPLSGARRGGIVAPVKEVKLVAPCLPKKILAMAVNFPGIVGYSPHMSEPLVFIKPGTCVCGPGDMVTNPFPELPWWGEAELAVVVKNKLRNASVKNVRKSILGFTIANDVSVENVEGRDHHLARSKCPDSFCPIGPWIDTEFDSSNCKIEAIQNGETIRRGRSNMQFWQWPRIVAWLSTWITLEPWDVVLTGNPPDTVGMRYLTDKAVYTARIEGLGELTNYFIKKKA